MRGVGIGFRPQLAAALLAAPRRVDFVEVVAEACTDARARREMIALAEVWPVLVHGVKLSLGSAGGIDEARARSLGKLARELKSPLVSEHVAFVRAGGREIGHLTELPMTREAVKVVAQNVATLRRHLPDVPLLLESVARGFVWDAAIHEMREGEFYAEIVRATGCDLLLDVANVYANALNAGREPRELLKEYPLDHVGLVHVAGGVVEGGFYYDTHTHPVPEAVFDLASCVDGSVPRLLERDGAYEVHESILLEVDRLRTCAAAKAPMRQAASRHRRHGDAEAPLADAQERMATRLTTSLPETDEAIVRARALLARKRAEHLRGA